jgi:hypothetical protein
MVQRAEAVLRETLASLQAQKAKLETQIRAIKGALATFDVRSPKLAARKRRRPMDAAERKSVSRRMKAYWAKRRAGKSAA